MKNVFLLCLLIVSASYAQAEEPASQDSSVPESISEAGREVGKLSQQGVSAAGEFFTEVGHAFRDVGRDIGHSVRDGWQEAKKSASDK